MPSALPIRADRDAAELRAGSPAASATVGSAPACLLWPTRSTACLERKQRGSRG